MEDKISKIEDKAVFTMSEGKRYAFIDTKKQLEERKQHTIVLTLMNLKAIDYITSAYGTRFQCGDSVMHGISIDTYCSISELLKRHKLRFNKKTCEIILRTNRENPTAI